LDLRKGATMPKAYIDSEKLRQRVLEMIESLEAQYREAQHKLHTTIQEFEKWKILHDKAKAECNVCLQQKSALMAILSLIDEFERR
jgi:molecular chaperone GrpE (heat shock protein)